MGPSGETLAVVSAFSREVIFRGVGRCVIQSHLQAVCFKIYFEHCLLYLWLARNHLYKQQQ